MPTLNKSFKRAGANKKKAVLSIALILSVTLLSVTLLSVTLFSCKGAGAGDDGGGTPGRAPGLYVNGAATPVAGTGTLAQALTTLAATVVSNGVYTIVIDQDASIPAHQLDYSNNQVKITLEGEGGTRTVQLTGTGALFTVGKNVTLILGNGVTLKGVTSNISALVFVQAGGKLNVAAGAVITGNKNNGAGGGVYASAEGTVEISGGQLIKNQATSGGGIRVDASATLTMSNGEISQNTSLILDDSSTGGAGILARGTVILTGGRVSNNLTSGSSAYGGGISMLAATSTLLLDGAEISGNQANCEKGGGGINISGGSATFKSGTIVNNTTTSTAYASSYNLRRMSGTFTNASGQELGLANGFVL